MTTTTYATNNNTAPGGAVTTVYTPSTAAPGTGMPVPAGGSVAELNAARVAAVSSGKSAYAGNLGSLSAYQASQTPAPVAPAATPAAPISASAVMNPPTPYSIPTPPATSSAATYSAAIAGSAAAGNAAIQSQLDAQTAADQKAATDSKNTVNDEITTLEGKGAVQTKMEADAGIPDKTQQLQDITNEYNTKQLAFRHAAENAYARAGNQASGEAAVAALDRQNNAELADIAVRQSVAQGNLKAAQDIVDHKIALQYGDLKDIIGYQMQFLQTNESKLSDDQKQALQVKIDQNTRQYDTETAAAKQLETEKLTTLQAAMEAGAPASIQTAIQAATTPEAAIAAAGSYVGGLDAEQKRASIAASLASADSSRASAAKTRAETAGDGTAGYNGDFAATIGLAANTGGTNAQRTATKANLQSLIAAKDYPSAYAAILQATAAGLNGQNKTDFQNRLEQYSVTSDLATQLKALKDAGYDTSKLTGGADAIGTKIGALTTDPKYAAVANQLSLAYQNYRHQMTGAAFSANEAAQYASVLPSAGNTFALNEAKIEGLNNFLTSTVDGYTKQVVGQGGVEIRKYAQGATPAAPAPDATAAPSVTVGGQTYVVGSILQNALGQKAKVNADGTVTPI